MFNEKFEDFEKYKEFCRNKGISPCSFNSLKAYYENK